MNTNGTERRHFIRADFSCKVIIEAPHERVFNIHTENIGAGGIRVFLGEKLDVSSLVGLEIYIGQQPIACKGRIVWVIDQPFPPCDKASLYDTGIEFYDITPQDKNIIGNIVKTMGSREKDKK